MEYISMTDFQKKSAGKELVFFCGVTIQSEDEDGMITVAKLPIHDRPKTNLEKETEVFFEIVDITQNYVYEEISCFMGHNNYTPTDVMKHMVDFLNENNLSEDFPVIKMIPTEHGILQFVVTSLNHLAFIEADKLEPINTAEQFFSTDKILYVSIIDMGLVSDIPPMIMKTAMTLGSPILHDDKLFIKRVIYGSPENLYIDRTESSLRDNIYMGGNFDLTQAISNQSLFDFSEQFHLTQNKIGVRLLDNTETIIENFIIGRELPTMVYKVQTPSKNVLEDKVQ